MTLLVIITTISILLSAFWLFKKPKTIYLEKAFTVVHFSFLILTILTIAFLFQGLRFIGLYTNSIIGLVFLISGIILFGLTTSKPIQMYTGLIAIPTMLTEIALLFGGTPFLLPGLIAYLIFAPPLHKQKIDEKYNFEIHKGAFLAPPNLFFLTKETAFIFDKQIPLTSSGHFSNISSVEILRFVEGEFIICKIHSGELPDIVTVDTLRY